MSRDEKLAKLRRERDEFWRAFSRLPKKGSFSAIHLSGKLNKIQQALDRLENGRKKSKRYYPEVKIDVI